jgi:citrate synthase
MPTTNLCHVSNDGILVRDRDLVNDIMGRMTFTEAFFLLLTGRNATPGEARIVDTVLITLMEHGLTPQAIAARLIYLSAPESLQGAMAAGLLGIGGQFAGTMEGAAKLLEEIVAAGADGEKTAKAIVSRYLTSKRSIPGFGNRQHKPDDPRTPRILAIAEENGLAGPYVDALKLLGREVDSGYKKHITINATGAIAAVLLEIEIPASLMRGLAVISRAAGLLAHLREEQTSPAALHLLNAAHDSVPYAPAGQKEEPRK